MLSRVTGKTTPRAVAGHFAEAEPRVVKTRDPPALPASRGPEPFGVHSPAFARGGGAPADAAQGEHGAQAPRKSPGTDERTECSRSVFGVQTSIGRIVDRDARERSRKASPRTRAI